MKILAIAFSAVLTGCGPNAQITKDNIKNTSEADYRLYQIPGRGEVLPGIAPEEKKLAAELCGTKIIVGISDVVKDDSELNQHKIIVEQATQYNLKTYEKCKKAKNH